MIKNRQEIEFIDDTCGRIQEMYHSDNLSIAYAEITGKAKSHKHLKMEEIYYVTKGNGKLYIGDDCYDLKPGDIIAIPKDIFHHLERTSTEPLEVIVTTYPQYDISDVIEKLE